MKGRSHRKREQQSRRQAGARLPGRRRPAAGSPVGSPVSHIMATWLPTVKCLAILTLGGTA